MTAQRPGRDTILNEIDHVLDDFATSPDAMRWTPEPQPAAMSRPGILLELPPPEWAAQAITLAHLEATKRAVSEAMNRFGRAVISRSRAWGKSLARWGHFIQSPNHDRARCRICSPFANPYPLVAGAEYRRRRQARMRRK